MTWHPRLATSGVCTFSWPMEETVAFWRRNAITRVGIALPRLGDVDAAGLLAGFEVVDVIDLSRVRLDEPAGWPAAHAEVGALIDVAARLGSPAAMISTGWSGAMPWDEAATAFRQAYQPLADAARERGMRLSFENASPLRPEFGFASTLRDTAELAASVGGGVCLEISNCWGERYLERTVADIVELIDVVQLNDYVLGTGRTPDRAVPGDGCIPLGRIVSMFESAGYAGPYELEMIGPRIDEEGADTATLRGLTVLSELFERLGVAAGH